MALKVLAQEVPRGHGPQGEHSLRGSRFTGAINLRLDTLNHLSLQLWGENQPITLLVVGMVNEGKAL